MNIFKSKESVVKVALVLTTVSTVTLGSFLYVNNENLGEAQKRIIHMDNDYKELEHAFLTTKSEKEKILEQVKEYQLTAELLESDKKKLEQEQEKLKEEIKTLKKNKIVADRKSSTATIDGYKDWTRLYVESTGYSTYENGDKLSGRKWGGITKSGTVPKWGTIAVDPNVIPLGTKVYIPEFGMVFTAEDTGSAIKNKKIDIFFNTVDEAMNWGRKKNVEVYVDYK